MFLCMCVIYDIFKLLYFGLQSFRCECTRNTSCVFKSCFWKSSSRLLIYRGVRELRNKLTGHTRITLSTIQWKWWLRDHESVTKLLYMLWAIRLAEKDHNRIYHIIIYSWHNVVRMWLAIWIGFFRSPTPRHISIGEHVRALTVTRLAMELMWLINTQIIFG